MHPGHVITFFSSAYIVEPTFLVAVNYNQSFRNGNSSVDGIA